MDPKILTGVLIRRDTQTHTGKRHVTTETEIGVTCLPSEEIARIAGQHRKLGTRPGRLWEDPGPMEGARPCYSLILDFQGPELRENTFLSF